MADSANPTAGVVAPVAVRYRDLDTLGHVNNAVYASYLEIGRVAFLRAVVARLGLPTSGLEFGVNVPFVLVELTIGFKSPAYLGETLEVAVRMPSAGRTSFAFEYEVRERESGRLVATGRSAQVMIDPATGSKAEVPQDFLDAVEAVQGAPVERR
ncbi:MAG: acyl-CoA thioesterase [Anaerolineales bacterium]|nr:acyl-CoA thioesterase [Anaerolineales bacterium]